MLSQQEFEKLKLKLANKSLDISSIAQNNQSEEEPGYFERVGQAYSGAAEDIISEIKRPAESVAQGASPLEVGKQLAETGLRTTGEVAGAAFAPITEALSPAIKPIVEKLVSIPGIRGGVEKIAEWAEKNPETAKDLEAVLNIAMLGVGTKAEPIVKNVAGSTIKATGKIPEVAGRTLKESGKKLYGVVIPMEQSTARAVQAYQAAKPTFIERVKGFLGKDIKKIGEEPIREAETAARYGVSGTEWQIGVQAKKISGKIWDDVISPALSKSTIKVSMKDFFRDLRKRIIAETPDLSRRRLLLKAWESMNSDFKKVSSISLTKLQEYKSGWAKFVPEKVYQGKPIAGALNEVRNMAAQEARSEIYRVLGNDLKQAYLDYGNFQSMIEAGIKSVDPLRSKSAFKQAWEFILDKTVTPIASYGGKVLYKTGDGLEFIGKEGLGKVGDFLRN